MFNNNKNTPIQHNSSDYMKELLECIYVVNRDLMKMMDLFGLPDGVDLTTVLLKAAVVVERYNAGDRSQAVEDGLDEAARSMVSLLDDLTIRASQVVSQTRRQKSRFIN